MISPLYWIETATPGRLAIMARPRAGDWLSDEVKAWLVAGVTDVVSLLEPEEVVELGLLDEAAMCAESNIDFSSFPIRDRDVPASHRQMAHFAVQLNEKLGRSRNIAIHCRAGIGRSAVVAACTLVAAGGDAKTAFANITRARGLRVPDTDTQRAWVEEFQQTLRR